MNDNSTLNICQTYFYSSSIFSCILSFLIISLERRLGADEAPLLVQLNWTAENQEGRFILRDESKPQTITRPVSKII